MKSSVTVPCEPQLGKRGLYPTISSKKSAGNVRDMMNLLAYCDGSNDLLEVAEIINKPVWELYDIANKLIDNKLLESIEEFDL